PAFGTILRLIKKNKHTKVVCIADNVVPHEHRPGDKSFTKYFLNACDAFITMSEKVQADLRSFEPNKPVRLVPHPLYDNFGEALPKEEARNILQLPLHEKLILFFGFIRHYKGLDMLLQAMADERIRKAGIKLLVAGEFYEDEQPYRESIQQNGLQESVILRTNFIPDSDVRLYLSAADCVVQPYRNATQSGVTPLAYHFEKPMIVTNVGGLPAMVSHQKVGLVAEPDPSSIAEAVLQFYQVGEDYFIPHLRNEKKKYAWANLTKAILEMAGVEGAK
ncbi:MAG TPA: glycosyltransferase, partial [Flavisolibacter sp.]|nr:glycosyltransferase [Flavisolibacter sp.]